MNGHPDQDVDGDEVGAVCCFVKHKRGQYPARMMALEHVKCKSNIVLTFNFSKLDQITAIKLRLHFWFSKEQSTRHVEESEHILSHILNEL